MSKSRLSPQDETSIPRLELLATVLAVNIDCTLRKRIEDTVKTVNVLVRFFGSAKEPG